MCKITADGKNIILGVVGEEGGRSAKTVVSERVGVSFERGLAMLINAGPKTYGVVAFTAGVLISGTLFWRSRRRQRRQA